MDCIFCKIAAGELPSNKIYEDSQVLVFHDIEPQAPTHLLAIPKTHLSGCAAVTEENSALVAHLFEVIAKVTAEQGITDYRVVSNQGAEAGQTVPHLHFHILAGRPLKGMG